MVLSQVWTYGVTKDERRWSRRRLDLLGPRSSPIRSDMPNWASQLGMFRSPMACSTSTPKGYVCEEKICSRASTTPTLTKYTFLIKSSPIMPIFKLRTLIVNLGFGIPWLQLSLDHLLWSSEWRLTSIPPVGRGFWRKNLSLCFIIWLHKGHQQEVTSVLANFYICVRLRS